ncbi:XRE family transcriptional regulator [Alloacidobacterium sp.]|uniref:LexA family transcriptional regulator n=1 Tax=Alloacidobacterium sp. TaxID=2951999 RepID=UPI002D25980C|nr:XRE family transcriptional regulator [Alloacidobacterium sp.]HYK37731.1 XRE family transcriptional regulator [Alloacidobacterium sp.]
MGNPQWSERIRQVLRDLKLTQADLAERLGVSPATVSRWTQGKHEPTAETYIALGNLAQRPDGIYFWERAGMGAAGLSDASLHSIMSSLRVSLRDFKLVASRRTSKQLSDKGNAVAIPLLNVTAFGDRIAPKENVSLSEVEVEDILLAPLSWCPHPEKMISMHVAGDSMYPLIASGSIIFVDTAVTDREVLDQKLTVVAHRDMGFKVARFQRLAGSDLMVSANHKCLPLDVSNASKWKIYGEVLWWVARDVEP